MAKTILFLVFCIALAAQAAASGTDYEIEKELAGHDRKFSVHLPEGFQNACTSEESCTADDEKLPLVFNFHALGSSPADQKKLTGFDTLADKKRFVVVTPQGLAPGFIEKEIQPTKLQAMLLGKDTPLNGYSWNAGGCCPTAMNDKVDDVQFVRELFEYITQDMAKEYELDFQIDLTRVYATGMSNGGFLSHRLGCKMSDVFAAIAPVVATLANKPPGGAGDPYECNPEHPMPVLQINGKLDMAVPWKGGQTVTTEKPLLEPLLGFLSIFQPVLQHLDFPSVTHSINSWRKINGDADPKDEGTVSYEKGDVVCRYWIGSNQANVTLCDVGDGGHNWPGGPSTSFCPRPDDLPRWKIKSRLEAIGKKALMDQLGLGCSFDLDATTEIYRFFEQNHR